MDDEEDEKEPKEFMHKYIIDLIAKHKDYDEELLLHWGVARQNPGEWTRPEDTFLPPKSVRWNDNVAC